MSDNHQGPLSNLAAGPMEVQGPPPTPEVILPSIPTNEIPPPNETKLPILAYVIHYWDGNRDIKDYTREKPQMDDGFLSYVDWFGNRCWLKSENIYFQEIHDTEEERQIIDEWAAM